MSNGRTRNDTTAIHVDPDGTCFDNLDRVTTNTTGGAPTVNQSLDTLNDAIGKATDDLSAVREIIKRARADIATHNTSISRNVVAAAARAVDHLKQVDEALRDVVKGLAERD
jgi:ABC-type transporter Mla subunit MlaD